MKVVLLHGPAINASRAKLSEIKNKFDPNNVIVFEKGADEKDVLAAMQTISLFGDDKLIIWENPPENFFPTTSIILWFDHEIDAKKYLAPSEAEGPKAEVYFFPEAKEISVFPFLDALGQRDKKAFLELDKLKQEYDSQYLITMILYLLRNLVATPKGAKDFVKNKMIRMRKNFSSDELISIYQFVLNTDFKIKSGLLDETRAQFLLVNKFIGI